MYIIMNPYLIFSVELVKKILECNEIELRELRFANCYEIIYQFTKSSNKNDYDIFMKYIFKYLEQIIFLEPKKLDILNDVFLYFNSHYKVNFRQIIQNKYNHIQIEKKKVIVESLYDILIDDLINIIVKY